MIPVSANPRSQSALLSENLVAYYRRVAESSLTVVDVETTGSRPHHARVIEIGVVQGSVDGTLEFETSYLINPGVAVPQAITQLTGITTPMVVDQGGDPETVWLELKPRLDGGVLTAHNLAFDYGFLQSEYQRLGYQFSRAAPYQFCTVLLSRLLLADLPSRSLPQLVKHFQFEVGPSHRALADARACWQLACVLLARLRELPDQVLLDQFAQQWIPLRYAAKAFRCSKPEVMAHLDARGYDRRISRRSNRRLYRRGDIEALYREIYPQQLSLPV
jgi:DNA polymerase-3 subunit epsilon